MAASASRPPSSSGHQQLSDIRAAGTPARPGGEPKACSPTPPQHRGFPLGPRAVGAGDRHRIGKAPLPGQPGGLPYKGNTGRFPEYDRPGRFVPSNPDDGEEFLRRCRERAEEQRRAYREQQRQAEKNQDQ
ncbi:hypothetical protein IL992_44220 [Microbispora sp. NEAU-D428]|uniref:hypothetical protein n=1 Tax=Microbispora sitophila TaxID=2771537 RepID=UPI001865D48D|nr:hypothetical protein [Microbispora sitophila]MBE3016108.1 hypothetical protein [Microbispora sitophila]